MGPLPAVKRFVRARPGALTATLTILGYLLILGTFQGSIGIYPDIDVSTSTTLSHATAALNAATVVLLLSGWWLIRRGRIRHHRIAMVGAFTTILLFLAVYLVRVGGGGTKTFVGPSLVRMAYLAMLGVHITLSVLAVPLVVYVLLLGLSHRPHELPATPHPRVGRIAASVWIVSLTLGLITYLLLEHLYAWEWSAVGG